MVHLLLRRSGWLAAGLDRDIAISGFEPCRFLFGL
jgi:hypothetical protein